MCTGQWKYVPFQTIKTLHYRSKADTEDYRDPADNSRYKDQLDYYLWLAKLADKGNITSIFFADGYGVMSTYQNSPDALFRGGSMVGYLDPVTL